MTGCGSLIWQMDTAVAAIMVAKATVMAKKREIFFFRTDYSSSVMKP